LWKKKEDVGWTKRDYDWAFHAVGIKRWYTIYTCEYIMVLALLFCSFLLCSFIYLFIHSFIYSFMYSSIHIYIYLFLFIWFLFVCFWLASWSAILIQFVCIHCQYFSGTCIHAGGWNAWRWEWKVTNSVNIREYRWGKRMLWITLSKVSRSS